MKKSTPEAIREVQKELQDWEIELKRLQDIAVLAASRSSLQNVELPALEKQIKAAEAEIPGLTNEADEVRSMLWPVIFRVDVLYYGDAVRLQRSFLR